MYVSVSVAQGDMMPPCLSIWVKIFVLARNYVLCFFFFGNYEAVKFTFFGVKFARSEFIFQSTFLLSMVGCPNWLGYVFQFCINLWLFSLLWNFLLLVVHCFCGCHLDKFLWSIWMDRKCWKQKVIVICLFKI